MQQRSIDPAAFHASLPGYAPTPLWELPELASRCGVGRLWLKDESSRLGLPSFKILGASWACYRALADRVGLDVGDVGGLDALRGRVAGAYTLVAATDGNHGRAVARAARWCGLDARIYVPRGMTRRRIAAIEGEGAEVVVVDGSYDDAVAASAAPRSPRDVVVSDTAWDGYQTVPQYVIDGYATIFDEVEAQLPPDEAVDVVVVQVGVGALATAVVRWASGTRRGPAPKVLAVEPVDAACLLRSLACGRPTEAPPPHRSAMAGLNCGNVSPVAWPVLSRGIDAAVAVRDEVASAAVAALESSGVLAGDTGAAGVAALLRFADDPDLRTARGSLGLDAARVLVLATEGRT